MNVDIEVIKTQALTASEVLALKKVERLFSTAVWPTVDQFKFVLRKLKSKWHGEQEANPSDEASREVFTRLTAWYEEGIVKLEQRTWCWSGTLVKFEVKSASKTGSPTLIEFIYQKRSVVPGVGVRYEGNNMVMWEVTYDQYDLVKFWEQNWNRITTTISASDKMKAHFADLLNASPQFRTLIGDAGFLVVYTKPVGAYNLQDVLDKFGKIPPEHVAWITSRLYDQACLWATADVGNAGLFPDAVWIQPELHKAVVFEGFQYSAGLEKKLEAAPDKTLRLCPQLRRYGINTLRTTLALIKNLGRTCLGDPHGISLGLPGSGVPKPFANWLISTSKPNPLDEWKAWEVAKKAAFKKEFVAWDMAEFNKFYE